MDIDERLPKNEAELLLILLKLPYHGRIGYALRLVNNHRNDPALFCLIQELLSTTLLSNHVPFPGKEDDDGYMTLLFPQSTASKRFFQRELGLAMASALGQPGLPFLLDAIIHPSMAGKSRAISACAYGATDRQLIDVYHKSVPATQESLHAMMVAAGRVEALKVLQLWKDPPPVAVSEPRRVTLEKDLKTTNPRDRDAVWTRAGLGYIKLHRRLHDPLYVSQDSRTDLVTTVLDLLESYPLTRHQTHPWNVQEVPSIPSSLDRRLHSFLKCDISRTLRLVRSICYIPDSEHRGRDLLELPSGFMHLRSSIGFWHRLPLEGQKEHLLPFILELMQVQNQVLLKNDQIRAANLLLHARWQIIVAVTKSALTYLENAQTLQAMSISDRDGIVKFVVHAIDTLAARLHRIAHRVDALASKSELERELGDLICCSADRILAASRVSASSDGTFVKSFMQGFTLPLLNGPVKRYPPLVQVLFDSIRGVFNIGQVSKSELVSTASRFFEVLKRRKPSVFDIPDDGIVHPYCGIGDTDNETVFRLLLQLSHPRDDPSVYVNITILEALSEQQRQVICGYFNDPEYLRQIFSVAPLRYYVFVRILAKLPSSPRARLPIVKTLLDHSKVDDKIASSLYPLLDISDTPSRNVLQKNTYQRLFADRYSAYDHLMTATLAQESPKEHITTMRFLIARFKNEHLPDAEQIPEILGEVTRILHLLDQSTYDEAKELTELYLAWEKQNNEAVSRVIYISAYIMRLASSALTHFAGSPTHPAFQFGMDLLWAREVFREGPLIAHKTYNIAVYAEGESKLNEPREFKFGRDPRLAHKMHNILSAEVQPKLNEIEELARRRFMLACEDAIGEMGYWRISDERQFADVLLKQYHKVHQTPPFEDSKAYPAFISTMLDLLGIRWTKVPALCEYTERQLGVLRDIVGSNKKPSDWVGKVQQEAIQYILRLRALYHDSKVTSETLSWWSEFRHLRLFSTDSSAQVHLLHQETFDSDRKPIQNKLDVLVKKLLDTDDSAVYIDFVRLHLMENRQDLLKDSHITTASVGIFNQLSEDDIPQPPPWEFTFPRRFYPRQCEIFAAKLLDTIHSGNVSLESQVQAAEHLTKLPTTTIIELADLLKEDLNQRVIEAILMFLPNLDEPASAIQFLLAPAYLDGDLARTAVFSVRNSLRHVPASTLPQILLPVFPTEDSKRSLKITVMKELVRLVCQHIANDEHQTFLVRLWRRKLHQDVRIAFLQSVISFLGTKQEQLGWTILRDAVSNHALVLDDALFALLAVQPTTNETLAVKSDIRVTEVSDPDILVDMAQSIIPSTCHDLYAEDILYPISQLSFVVSETFPNLSEKEATLVRERVRLLQQSAYHSIFSRFLSVSNAHVFAQRGLDAAKSVALDVQPEDLFTYFVYGIGRCVALDPQCWDVLCGLVDFLGNAVGNCGKEPTNTSVLALRRLRSMHLSSNMTFQRPEIIRRRLTVDRMTLLEPLVEHGCDHFEVLFWERRFHLFSSERQRVSFDTHTKVLSSELDEARNLMLDLTRLSEALEYDFEQLKSKTLSIIDIASAPVADTLIEDILVGNHGVDGVWINELRLLVLGRRVRTTLDYAQSLATFQSQVSTYHKTFYAKHGKSINGLISSVLTQDPQQRPPKDLVATVLDPIFERAKSSAWDSHLLDLLLDDIPDVILSHRPQWGIERISTVLASVRPWEVSSSALRPAVQLVEFVNTTCVVGTSTGHKGTDVSEFTPPAALLVEAIYSGNLKNFDLEQLISNSAQKTEPVLLYPYYVSSEDDGSGGDIENRRSKATVSQLLDRYQEWKTTHASQYLSGVHPPQLFPSALSIVKEILKPFPQLAVVHPSLFLSYAAVTFGSEVDMTTKINNVLSHLQGVLKPSRQRESGTRWGWAPPLSLTISFVRILLTETANEVADTVLDNHADMGPLTCKLAALELLKWWTQTFYGVNSERDLVKAMERGEGREDLMRQYDEIRLLACGDDCRIVREKGFVLPSGNVLKPGHVTQWDSD